MTFKVKSGFNVGSTPVVDSNSYFQQTESAVSVQPSLAFDFTSKSLDRRIAYTRASNGSFMNSDGWIEWNAADKPRFEYDPLTRDCKGLLMEEARTTYVYPFQDWLYYSGADSLTIAPFVTLAPDGTMTASRITSTITGGSNNGWVQKPTGSVTADSSPYTASVFVKQGTSPKVTLNASCYGGTYTDILVTITWSDLSVTYSGTRGSTPTNYRLVPYPNGWYRLSTTIYNNGTNTGVGIRVYVADNFSSLVTGQYTYIWGPQIEAGYHPSSVIFPNEVFTGRSSNATYQDNADAFLRYAGSNVVRYNWNRYTKTNTTQQLERQGTNLFLYSSDMTQSTWTKNNTTATANTTTGPDGSVNGVTLAETTAASNTHTTWQAITVSAGALTNPYTFSVYVKANGRTQISLILQEWQTYTRNSGATFDITPTTNGRVVTSYASVAGVTMIDASIEYVTYGWYRCSLSVNLGSSDTVLAGIVSLINGGTNTYTGDGTSGVYLWGAQLEATEYKTSFIPTAAATVTRSQDNYSLGTATRASDSATLAAPNLYNWFNNNEGTVVMEFQSDSPMTGSQGVGFNKYPQPFNFNGTSSTAVLWYGSVAENSTNGTYNNYGAVPTYTNIKLALAVANTGGQTTTVYNGGNVLNFSGTKWAKDLNGVGIGCTSTGIFQLGGTVKNFSYYPKQLDNNTIVNLTIS